MKSKLTHKRFTGKIFWLTPNIFSLPTENEVATTAQVADVPRAILIDNKMSVEWKSNKFGIGEIKLHSKDKINFQGTFSYKDDGETIVGMASGRLFEINDECLLKGQWVEEGDELSWIIELKKVSKFPDENK